MSPKKSKTTTKAANKKTATKAAPAVKSKKQTPLKEAYTKSLLTAEIGTRTGLSKKQVTAVFESIDEIIEQHVKPKSIGEFTLPGLLKITVHKKPATKARKGINPFTKEETIFKAKPARNVLKIKPLKKLKDKLL
jgi:nucleoid DNA-binding protein